MRSCPLICVCCLERVCQSHGCRHVGDGSGAHAVNDMWLVLLHGQQGGLCVCLCVCAVLVCCTSCLLACATCWMCAGSSYNKCFGSRR